MFMPAGIQQHLLVAAQAVQEIKHRVSRLVLSVS